MIKRKKYQVSAVVNGRLEFVIIEAFTQNQAAFNAAMFLRDKFEDEELEAELVSVTFYKEFKQQ